MIELDQQALGAVQVVSEHNDHHALPRMRVGSHGTNGVCFRSH